MKSESRVIDSKRKHWSCFGCRDAIKQCLWS